jgi:hypothetical protein
VDILLLWVANAGVAKLTATIAAPKISLVIFAMIFVLASGQTKTIFYYLCRAEDWITLPQIPSRFLEVLWGCVRSFGVAGLVYQTKQRPLRRPRRRVNRAD